LEATKKKLAEAHAEIDLRDKKCAQLQSKLSEQQALYSTAADKGEVVSRLSSELSIVTEKYEVERSKATKAIGELEKQQRTINQLHEKIGDLEIINATSFSAPKSPGYVM
jgi:chromosome segregation ATPase